MSLVERCRMLYEHEKDCNFKMLAMLDSVPDAARSDARFLRAVTLAAHLAAGRERWLDHMTGNADSQVAWWESGVELASLRPRFAALESRWTDYLARLDDDRLAQDFEFRDHGECFRLPIGVQIEQLVGHAAYHRGQVALLVDQLGGETVDTDYTDWWWYTHH